MKSKKIKIFIFARENSQEIKNKNIVKIKKKTINLLRNKNSKTNGR